MKAVFAVLALFVVFAVAFADAEPAKDLKGSEQFYYGYAAPYAAPYASYAYGAYPYAAYSYYYR